MADDVRIAVLASGTGSNFRALVERDTSPGRVVLMITDVPNAPVLEAARELGIEGEYRNPGSYRTRMGLAEEKDWADHLISKGIDLVCLAGFMRLLKGPVLKAYAGRIMNIHPSLLPAFPGLNAQLQAFDYGVRIAGCTVHYVDSGTDTGPVIIQESLAVGRHDTPETLASRILELEHSAYPAAVRHHCRGQLEVDGRRVLIKDM